MNFKSLISIILIVLGLFLVYTGVNKISNNQVSVEVLDIELGVENETGKTEGIIYTCMGALLVAGGLYNFKK